MILIISFYKFKTTVLTTRHTTALRPTRPRPTRRRHTRPHHIQPRHIQPRHTQLSHIRPHPTTRLPRTQRISRTTIATT